MTSIPAVAILETANRSKERSRVMGIDKQSSKMAFVCDVCSARFEAEDTDQQPAGVHALWVAAKKLGWHSRQQRGGKWHTACPECATDDWKLWNWK
jgi:transcription elongation factor Elf1